MENNEKAGSSDLNVIEYLKIKKKQKWTPKETHNTIDTVSLVEIDMNNVKMRKNKNKNPR